jgi:phosphoglycerate dehydrogenase-like enzyme
VESGRLAGVALDVLEREPPADDDPLIRAWRDPSHPAHRRVLLTPHAAFYSEESRRDLRTKAARTCRRALQGDPIDSIVN